MRILLLEFQLGLASAKPDSMVLQTAVLLIALSFD